MHDPTTPPRRLSLPPGWIAEVVTWLEMTEPAATRPDHVRGELDLARIHPTPDAYRHLFRLVGEPWIWGSRLRLDDAALSAIIDDPAVECYELRRGEAAVGLLELDFRKPPECELAFFGVVPSEIGSGAGRFLMNRAIEHAWAHAPRITRFFVHTCTNDHPAALDFYRRSGFVPYARSVECYPDPRIDGILPRTAAPQIPLIGG